MSNAGSGCRSRIRRSALMPDSAIRMADESITGFAVRYLTCIDSTSVVTAASCCSALQSVSFRQLAHLRAVRKCANYWSGCNVFANHRRHSQKFSRSVKFRVLPSAASRADHQFQQIPGGTWSATGGGSQPKAPARDSDPNSGRHLGAATDRLQRAAKCSQPIGNALPGGHCRNHRR